MSSEAWLFGTELQVKKKSQLTASVHKEQSTRIHEEINCLGEHSSFRKKMSASVKEEGWIFELILICVSLVFPALNVLISSALFSYNNRNQFQAHCVFTSK